MVQIAQAADEKIKFVQNTGNNRKRFKFFKSSSRKTNTISDELTDSNLQKRKLCNSLTLEKVTSESIRLLCKKQNSQAMYSESLHNEIWTKWTIQQTA